uniref:F-box domain-containing protein n=1 Tax=Tanacetum cinerariifolium TaxID=118510 RepID=A0A699JEQ4_TANCI|nr:hypothetical protein [Tanacetum cinerariifolium]
MHRLSSSIMLDIFSSVPAKCLARSRCVSKAWCEYIDDRYLTTVHDKRVIEEPTPILYHTRLFQDKKFRSLCFHVIESKQTETGTPLTYVLEQKEYPFLEFLRQKPLKKSSDVRIKVRGSCNGLMCLSQDERNAVTSLVVVHPLKKERYEVPPLPMRFDSSMFRESCGLGFDASTNTLKMGCVLLKDHGAVPSMDHDVVWKNLCTMVHEIGINSWREIPHVPPYHLTDGAISANEKEEFGLIDQPKRMCAIWRDHYSCIDDHLVDLNGEVGFVSVRTMEFWADRLKWVDENYEMLVFTNDVLKSNASIKNELTSASIFLIISVTKQDSVEWIQRYSRNIPNIVCFDSSPILQNKLGGSFVPTEVKGWLGNLDWSWRVVAGQKNRKTRGMVRCSCRRIAFPRSFGLVVTAQDAKTKGQVWLWHCRVPFSKTIYVTAQDTLSS